MTCRPAVRTLITSLALSVFLCAFSAGCRGGVKHPNPGEENDEKYCKNRPEYENNCMACSALPGCGWCDSPAAGNVQCQPGTEHEAPSTCKQGWALSSEDCATPPPPPPPPPGVDSEVDGSE